MLEFTLILAFIVAVATVSVVMVKSNHPWLAFFLCILLMSGVSVNSSNKVDNLPQNKVH